MKIIHEDKLRFRIEVKGKDREISFVCDQPVEEGGTDQGPTPVEMLVASLGACVATMIGFYANQKKIDITGMSADVSFEKLKNPYRVGSINVFVNYPGETDDRLQKTLERIAHTCIIHHTLENPPQMQIRFPWTQ